MFRYNRKIVQDILNWFFKPILDIHDYNRGSCTGLYARQPKIELGKYFISYRGPVFWDKIFKDSINPETSEATFKKFLKKSLLRMTFSEILYQKVLSWQITDTYVVFLLCMIFGYLLFRFEHNFFLLSTICTLHPVILHIYRV